MHINVPLKKKKKNGSTGSVTLEGLMVDKNNNNFPQGTVGTSVLIF